LSKVKRMFFDLICSFVVEKSELKLKIIVSIIF
jgi:hypothetical protein